MYVSVHGSGLANCVCSADYCMHTLHDRSWHARLAAPLVERANSHIVVVVTWFESQVSPSGIVVIAAPGLQDISNREK